MASDTIIRTATMQDAPAIAAIYAHHVLHGTATFELVPPNAAEIGGRIDRIVGAGWPWLVAHDGDGDLVGYAYAGQMAPRAAFRYACETSIYLRHDRLGRGIGSVLLAALLEAASAAGFRQAVALVAGTQPASITLHAKAGFTEAGRLRSVGRKHGEWLDLLYMQRPLGEGDASPPKEEP